MLLKSLLVTGGAGYIGSRFVKTALRKNYKVTLVDRFFFDNKPKNKIKNLHIIQEDTRKFKLSSIKYNIDYVVDFAAISNDPSSYYFKKQTNEINYKARFELAKQSKSLGIKKYILPSSCSIYGASNKILDEKSKPKPLTNYSKANLLAEKKILTLSSNNFCVSVLRFGTIFGFSPKMRLDLVLNAMVVQSIKQGKLNLMKDGSQFRPLLHIQDAVNSVLFMLKTNDNSINKNIFNVGSTKFSNYQIKKLSKLIQSSLKKKIKINWYGDPDKRNYRVNFSKIEKLGFKCKYDATYGIKELKSKINKIDINDPKFYTLNWYKYLEYSDALSSRTRMHEGQINI